MKLLLDTHILIWAARDVLPKKARDMVVSLKNTVYFSPISVWEVVIKYNLKKVDFDIDPEKLRDRLLVNEYKNVPVTLQHAMAVNELPSIHKDPFDRMLIAQAKFEGMLLVTHDDNVAKYPGQIVRV